MKDVVAMMLSAQSTLARSGVAPRRDLTFAYFADEEQGGTLGSAWLTEHRPDLFAGVAEAVGEVGGFAVTLPNGRRIYPIQCAEKGMLWARVSAAGPGGHAAFSDAPNPTVLLAQATQRLAELRTEDPPPAAFRLLVERVGALLGDTGSDPASLLARLGSFGTMSLKAARTTFVPTVAHAGAKINVIPDTAELFVDCRFVPGGLDNALAALRSALGEGLDCELVTTTPGLAAPPDGPLAAACQAAVDAVDPGATVVPWALAAGTDGQRLAALGIACYGFAPLVLPSGFDYPAMFHAVDERVPIAALVRGSEILARLVATY
jgi:acetylornithine deacetylase/succinyl-diaminopimelate desuccinylase-like protein